MYEPPVAPPSVSPATHSHCSSMTVGCTPWIIAVPTWASPCTGAPCKTASSPATGITPASTSRAAERSTSLPTRPVSFRWRLETVRYGSISRRGEDRPAYLRQRLRDGLERNISLVVSKSAIGLLGSGEDPAEPFRVGLEFGSRYRRAGWGQGLTMHTCMMNLMPHLAPEDRPRALYHGLSAVSRDSAGEPPRFSLRPLPTETVDLATLRVWFRRFVEVRDSEGAERCIVSAVRTGADPAQMADLLFCAATDHRYLDSGHILDFTNKTLEALDIAGWSHAEVVLSSLAEGYVGARRMEESNSWRNPVDLVQILEAAFEQLPDALESGRDRRGRWEDREELAPCCWERMGKPSPGRYSKRCGRARPKRNLQGRWRTRPHCA